MDCRPVECQKIREILDATLETNNGYRSADTAQLIFPYNHWVRQGYPPRQELFDWYLNEFLPRLKARKRQNCNGTYFQRMIDFRGTVIRGNVEEITTKNQLDHIIHIWHRNQKRPRQSALQVSIFDPVKDHTGQPVRGFPCLQQISFTYDNQGGLGVNAYYPTQYIFDRAYGNYLGLCHLGHFMAHELRLNLVRLTCYIGHPELGTPTKSCLRILENTIRELVPNNKVMNT